MEVAPERLAGWLTGFAERHGPCEAEATGELVRYRAADGALAECRVPFPPLRVREPYGERLIAHAAAERRVGVLLVRLGGYAAGVFEGTRLVASKVGSRQVHGRSAAGGWSQQRFARRREKQAGQALAAAAEVAVRVLGEQTLEAVVFGGDRRAVDALRGDPRLAGLFALETAPFLSVPDPRLAVLKDAPRLFRAVRIRLVEPPRVD